MEVPSFSRFLTVSFKILAFPFFWAANRVDFTADNESIFWSLETGLE